MSKLNVEIISKTQIIFSDKVNLVVVPATEGEIGFMHNHELVISSLKAGQIKIFGDKENLITSIDIKSGFAEMADSEKLIILID